MADFDYLSSLNAMSRYHRIPMDKDDEEKTSFHNRRWDILLQGHAFWLKKCRGHVLAPDRAK